MDGSGTAPAIIETNMSTFNRKRTLKSKYEKYLASLDKYPILLGFKPFRSRYEGDFQLCNEEVTTLQKYYNFNNDKFEEKVSDFIFKQKESKAFKRAFNKIFFRLLFTRKLSKKQIEVPE